MKLTLTLFSILLFCIGILSFQQNSKNNPTVLSATVEDKYWLLLYRKSNVEYLYTGVPGEIEKSNLVNFNPSKRILNSSSSSNFIPF